MLTVLLLAASRRGAQGMERAAGVEDWAWGRVKPAHCTARGTRQSIEGAAAARDRKSSFILANSAPVAYPSQPIER